MLMRQKQYYEIVVALVNGDMIMRALDFALIHNVHSMKLGPFLD